MAANNLRMVPFGAWSGLDVLVEPDEGSVLPPQDPFSLGLLQAIWSAMFAMTESVALWFALSPRTWAEIGDPQFTLSRPIGGHDQTALPGGVKSDRELSLSSLPFTLPSNPQPDDLAVAV